MRQKNKFVGWLVVCVLLAAGPIWADEVQEMKSPPIIDVSPVPPEHRQRLP